jgi:hypothetical protein
VFEATMSVPVTKIISVISDAIGEEPPPFTAIALARIALVANVAVPKKPKPKTPAVELNPVSVKEHSNS